jgi:sRNA-binding carbon storage regulator CsrA
MPILVWKRGQVIQLSAGVTVQVLDANHGEVRVALQPTDGRDVRERIRRAVEGQNRNAALTNRGKMDAAAAMLPSSGTPRGATKSRMVH